MTGRSGRVVVLVIFICLVNGFDLAFTLLAHQTGHFHEANPLARPLLSHSTALIAFKVSAVVAASVIFIVFRRYWLTEIACWVFGIVYMALSLAWNSYYDYLSRSAAPAGS